VAGDPRIFGASLYASLEKPWYQLLPGKTKGERPQKTHNRDEEGEKER